MKLEEEEEPFVRTNNIRIDIGKNGNVVLWKSEQETAKAVIETLRELLEENNYEWVPLQLLRVEASKKINQTQYKVTKMIWILIAGNYIKMRQPHRVRKLYPTTKMRKTDAWKNCPASKIIKEEDILKN